MLSYQHAYHAGNAADVHKHAMLAWALAYLTQKPKPLAYIETHAARALYDLDGAEARKTNEAAAGIKRAEPLLPKDHPYLRALAAARARQGPNAYAGSPLIADTLLRHVDQMILAERHPAEATALRATDLGADIRETDGPAMALSITPPTPRRGLLLIDPSYEIKTEFTTMPKLLQDINRKWPVGVLILWYPILTSGAEREMVFDLDALPIEKSHHHQVSFPPANPGHGMIGSGLFVINPPWGWEKATQDIAAILEQAAG